MRKEKESTSRGAANDKVRHGEPDQRMIADMMMRMGRSPEEAMRGATQAERKAVKPKFRKYEDVGSFRGRLMSYYMSQLDMPMSEAMKRVFDETSGLKATENSAKVVMGMMD